MANRITKAKRNKNNGFSKIKQDKSPWSQWDDFYHYLPKHGVLSTETWILPCLPLPFHIRKMVVSTMELHTEYNMCHGNCS